jgi:hypothetical protein
MRPLLVSKPLAVAYCGVKFTLCWQRIKEPATTVTDGITRKSFLPPRPQPL